MSETRDWTHLMKRGNEALRVRIERDRVYRGAFPETNGYGIELTFARVLEEAGWLFEERVLNIREQVAAIPEGARFILKVKEGRELLCKRTQNATYKTLHNDNLYSSDAISLRAYTGIEILPDVHVHEFIGRPSACYCGETEA